MTTRPTLPKLFKSKDFLAGVLFATAGLAAISARWLYDHGSLSMMGPGYFPALVGSLLFGLGLFICIAAALATAPEPIAHNPRANRAIFWILVGILGFALVVEQAGFLLSAFGILLVTRQADPRLRWGEVVLFSAAAALGAAFIFITGLGMSLTYFPPGWV